MSFTVVNIKTTDLIYFIDIVLRIHDGAVVVYQVKLPPALSSWHPTWALVQVPVDLLCNYKLNHPAHKEFNR